MFRSDLRGMWRVAAAGCLVSCALAPAAGSAAETVPASVRACTLETDSLKRLICFDKEVARYTGQPEAKQGAPAAPVAKAAPPPAGSDAAADESPAPPPVPSKPPHITARIVKIEDFADEMVLHLDNNQVWEQVQEAPADMNLHTGDTISIDRELGSYWLSGANGTAMKVKEKKPRK
jgi:hypothetical protein